MRGPGHPEELEGPEELDLILLDNGRSAQIAGKLREALYCLRCGACLNVCPVYRQIGGHAYGHTYPGPIGILLTAMLKGDRSVKELAHASSLCGACHEVCPVRIDIPRMLVDLREGLDRDRIAPWASGWCSRCWGVSSPRRCSSRWRGGSARGAILRRAAHAAAARLRPWTRSDLPPVAAKTFTQRWKVPVTMATREEMLGRSGGRCAGAAGALRGLGHARPAESAAAAVAAGVMERWPAALALPAGAERVAGVFHRVASLPSPGVIRDLARQRGARSVVGWEPAALGFDLRATLEPAGLLVTAAPPGGGESVRLAHREAAAGAQIGVTGVDWALAETGTLILVSGSGRPRSTSLLPDTHVAVFGKGHLLESLEQLGIMLEALHADPARSPSGAMISFITGPSRTADIELTLTRGVHGPKEVHAVFVEAL